jgi:prepilin peptidase CpaA
MTLTWQTAWLVTLVIVPAAVIDGWKLRVPNALTYPFALAGLAHAAWAGGWAGLGLSAEGLALGLVLLLPLYAVGGMGAGDVKLLAGIGAWVGPELTFASFVATAFIGGAIALVMMWRTGDLIGHLARMKVIADEILAVRNPVKLSELAAARKPRMLLLPYGIPITLGTIATLAWHGFLVAA